MDKRLIGEYGEIVAARYLRKHGYIIVEGNYHCKFGEIDIVAEDKKYIKHNLDCWATSCYYQFNY